jgi:hypothetical protein
MGLASWTTAMQNGLTDQQLAADFAASDEFYSNARGTDAGWVNAVYKLLLGRPAESSAQIYWMGQLGQGQTRLQVAQRIANSTENDTQLINNDYFHYLGRTSDSDGLSFWLSQMEAGQTNENIVAELTGSAEYFNEHTT